MAFITQSGLITSTNDVFDRITGTSVNDTVVYSLATSSVNVSLSIVGTQNTGGSGFDELISIENITGSNFNDNFQGNSGNNVFNGGAGIDTVSYANATGSVIVSLTLPGSQFNVGSGSDTLISIENLIGSLFSDTITGNLSNNFLSGGSGNDTIFGTAGSDVIEGGVGTDTANYSALSNVVTLGALGVLNKGALGTDTLIGVESIIGSSLLGDTVDLSGASVAPATGTVANLTSGVVTVNGTAPLPLNFTVSQFENVIGSGFADTITGNISNNSLSGGGGNDTISGGNGADTITGGAGKDQLTGEAGIDVFVYSALADSLLSNFDIITDYSLGDILDRPGLALTTLNTSSGIASGSSAAQVGSFLNNFIFTSNTSLAFSAIGSSGTFIAFNDTIAGFNALTDSILWLPNYLVNSTNTVAIV